jgi:hypothetical protein
VPRTKQLHELTLAELSGLLLYTTHQFIAALKNDSPIDELQVLRDYLTAIRKEIRQVESQGY